MALPSELPTPNTAPAKPGRFVLDSETRIQLRQRRVRSLCIALALIPLGVVWRMAPLHLSPFAHKWGGSLLWAAMVYFFVAAALPAWTSGRTALLAGTVATAVELSRLFHTPGLDAFRLTLTGKLLLGRVFSLWDIVAYWAAIAAIRRLDTGNTSRRTST